MPDRHTTIRASQLRNFSITAEDLAANSISEDKLVITNDPFDDGYLRYSTTSSGMEWAAVSSGVSLASGTDNYIVRYDGTDALQSSNVVIDDGGSLIIPNNTSYRIKNSGGINSNVIILNGSDDLIFGAGAGFTGDLHLRTSTSTRMIIKDNGKIGMGIGAGIPSSLLTVSGVVESIYGGFKFPDGTTQTTAASNPSTLEMEYFTLDATDVSNKYVTLSHSPVSTTEVSLDIIKGCAQFYGADYTVSGTQVGWSGLGLDGILEVSDELRIMYMY